MQCRDCDATAMFRVDDGEIVVMCADHARYHHDNGAEVVGLAE